MQHKLDTYMNKLSIRSFSVEENPYYHYYLEHRYPLFYKLYKNNILPLENIESITDDKLDNLIKISEALISYINFHKCKDGDGKKMKLDDSPLSSAYPNDIQEHETSEWK